MPALHGRQPHSLFPDGRRDFFIPVREGGYYNRKMTRLWSLNAPRSRAIDGGTTHADIRRRL